MFQNMEFKEKWNLIRYCQCLFPEKKYREIDEDFIGNLNSEILKRAYKKLMLECHPDRIKDVSGYMIKLRTQECQRVNEAYHGLCRYVAKRNDWIYEVLTSGEIQTACRMEKPKEKKQRSYKDNRRLKQAEKRFIFFMNVLKGIIIPSQGKSEVVY